MKKKLLIILLMCTFILCFPKEDYITSDSIRFRVIANSNSSLDILMKEKVVYELSNMLFKEGDIGSTRVNIINNLSNIENKIETLFNNNNYDMSYNIMYGLNEFPEKEYNGIKYEEGLYESLVIEIGEGKGNNYWCFLYPSLCMIEYNKNSDENIKYHSKIIEIIDNLFNVNN